MSWLIVFISFLAFSSFIIANDPCKFTDSDKGVIDLTSLGKTDGTAAFPDRVAEGSSYSTLI